MNDKPVVTTADVRALLATMQGKEVTLDVIRKELHIVAGSKSFDEVRNVMYQLANPKSGKRIVVASGKKNGAYKVIEQVVPVQIYGQVRERRPVFNLVFPRDAHTGRELHFADAITIREGDLITIGGVKSKGKTTLCLQFCGENIDMKPILMGNEYTVLVTDDDGSNAHYEPSPRFVSRLDVMSSANGGWIDWIDENGEDKFTLLPVRDDYAEHVVKNKLNIIDWINLDGDKLYNVGKTLEDIKKNQGRGITIAALQMGEGAMGPRGGQFVRDFSDVEILLDGFGQDDNDILLTVRGAKEKSAPIVGRTYAYTIGASGTKIFRFREVEKCPFCHGQGYSKGIKCEYCFGNKYMDIESSE